MKHKYKVYLDTSVISALYDARNPERKILTEQFFREIELFEIFVSEITMSEIENTPDTVLRTKMMKVSEGFFRLTMNSEIEQITTEYVRLGIVPEKYKIDARHIALASYYDMDFVVSWNFKHIVKRKTKDTVRMVNTHNNLKQIEIVTPAELLQ